MSGVRIEVDDSSVRAHVNEGKRLWHVGLGNVLAMIGEALASAMQGNIRSGGQRLADRGISWPKLHPVTQKIRAYYGHGATDDRLIRGGDLLHSVRVTDTGASHVDVGSLLPYAATVHHGGTNKHGQKVQAFPWAVPSLQDLEDIEISLLDHLLPAGGR